MKLTEIIKNTLLSVGLVGVMGCARLVPVEDAQVDLVKKDVSEDLSYDIVDCGIDTAVPDYGIDLPVFDRSWPDKKAADQYVADKLVPDTVAQIDSVPVDSGPDSILSRCVNGWTCTLTANGCKAKCYRGNDTDDINGMYVGMVSDAFRDKYMGDCTNKKGAIVKTINPGKGCELCIQMVDKCK